MNHWLDGGAAARISVNAVTMALDRMSIADCQLLIYSYLKASAGKILDADQDGYSVASSETAMAVTATSTPCTARGANGT